MNINYCKSPHERQHVVLIGVACSREERLFAGHSLPLLCRDLGGWWRGLGVGDLELSLLNIQSAKVLHLMKPGSLGKKTTLKFNLLPTLPLLSVQLQALCQSWLLVGSGPDRGAGSVLGLSGSGQWS